MTKRSDSKTVSGPIGPFPNGPQIVHVVRRYVRKPNIAEFIASVNLDAPRISGVGRYVAAIALVTIAMLARVILTPILDSSYPYVMFFPAIVFSAWIGGWWPGVAALALSGLITSYFWPAPRNGFGDVNVIQQISLLMFATAGLTVSALGEAQLRHRIALSQSEALYRGFLEAVNEGVMLIDESGGITYVNPIGAKLLDATREQVLGKSMFDLIFAEDLEDVRRHWEEVRLGNNQQCEARVHRTNLSMFWANFNATPTYKNGRFAGTLCMVTDITERKRTEAEIVFSLRREALLNKITATLRDTTNTDRIQFVAVRELGMALGADRAFFRAYDLSDGRSWVGEDYHREDLESVSGVYSTETYGIRPMDVYGNRKTQIIQDIESSGWPEPLLQGLRANRVRSLVSSPVFEAETLVGTLTVAMADVARKWTDDDVALIEVVAAQTRAALQSARAHEREHRIATELQQALQPPVASRTPGLEVAAIMRAAWDEAEIGGDFYDVFSLDANLTALIIGDVSGKGLAAAAQLATVRNCLRSTLYLMGILDDVLESASRVLTVHDLLTGFVTAFISIYDAADGMLSYAACGHEPGIVLRADGRTELIGAPGPPLGVAGMPKCDVNRVGLEPGDTIVLYTDGLTESGVSRQELLGSDGLAKLVAELPRCNDPKCLGEAIMSAASSRSGGKFHDDVCLLIATRSA